MPNANQNPIEIFELICRAFYRKSLTSAQQLKYLKFCMDSNVGNTPFDPEFLKVLQDAEQTKAADLAALKPRLRAIEQQSKTLTASSAPRINHAKRIILYAAAAVAVLVGSVWLVQFLGFTKNQRNVVTPEISKEEIQPAKPRATLKLGNNTFLTLDDLKNGEISSQGKTVIQKEDSNQITYIAGSTPSMEKLENTLFTPRGGFYQIKLPDGSRLYLNAESEVTFPVNFTGKTRVVKVKGEVYFDVVHDGAKPFIVITDNFTSKVLGTTFNINTYGDAGSTSVTLLTGSVEITKGGQSKLLKPAQQAIITEDRDDFSVKNDVDTAGITSWKSKIFTFEDLTLPEIIKEVSRWYNKPIVIEQTLLEQIGKNRITIREIPRTITLEAFLNKLAYKYKFTYTKSESEIMIIKG